MLTFAQFLTEKYLTGIKGRFDYAEIWVNPTPSDFAAVNASQYGAILSKGKLYVWDRDAAEHHDVQREIPAIKRDPNWLPLYVYYRNSDKRLIVDIAGYSMHGEQPTRDQLVKMVRAVPGFKNYNIQNY